VPLAARGRSRVSPRAGIFAEFVVCKNNQYWWYCKVCNHDLALQTKRGASRSATGCHENRACPQNLTPLKGYQVAPWIIFIERWCGPARMSVC